MTPAESLDLLVADGIVDAVVQRVKTGKEAEVFVVRKGESYLAAKVYKERTARTFKNNVGYKEGRVVRNTRDQRAMARGSKYGKELSENDWMHTEHDALVTLTAAGVRVPKAELFYEGILLMELVLDAEGQPAPRLIELPLSPEQAREFHRDIVGQIVRMLTCDLIHGDLSPYNILLAWNGPTIIDLPQVIKAAHNSQSEQFLVRDVRNVTEFFARFAPELRHRSHDGHAIWKKYSRRELSPDYFPEEGEGLAARPIDDGRRKQGRNWRSGPRPQANGTHASQSTAPQGTPQNAASQPVPHRSQQPSAPTPGPVASRPPPPPRQANGVERQANGVERQSNANGDQRQRGARPPRPTGAGAKPQAPAKHQTPAKPSGPEIVRVNRLVPPAPAEGAPPAGRPSSRFSQHHRHRRP